MELPIVRCDPSRLAELYELRARVWIDEGADPRAFPNGSWSDDRDADRIHWVALDEGHVVAGASLGFCSSLGEMEEPGAYVIVPAPPRGTVAAPTRVVVDKAHRGRGLAAALLDRQDAAARKACAVLGCRQASPSMRRILEPRGWRYHGPGPADPRFPGIEFSVMSLVLEEAHR